LVYLDIACSRHDAFAAPGPWYDDIMPNVTAQNIARMTDFSTLRTDATSP
jgi:hypothetical protein